MLLCLVGVVTGPLGLPSRPHCLSLCYQVSPCTSTAKQTIGPLKDPQHHRLGTRGTPSHPVRPPYSRPSSPPRSPPSPSAVAIWSVGIHQDPASDYFIVNNENFRGCSCETTSNLGLYLRFCQALDFLKKFKLPLDTEYDKDLPILGLKAPSLALSQARKKSRPVFTPPKSGSKKSRHELGTA